jgi:5-oxoprolinase (ATP-hydrolysing) subunit B
LGESALVLSVSESTLMAVQRRLWTIARDARRWDGVVDAVCGAGNLTLFAGADVDFDRLGSLLLEAWDESEVCVDDGHSRLVEIPVVYGGDAGPDIGDVAERAGVSEREVLELHAAGEYVVMFLGFLPGFAYLGGLDGRLSTPRRRVPRVSVVAGSVGIGGELTGVYPVASPGGWNVIGRTDVVLFDALRARAALLGPGDRVRFVAL